MDNPTHTPASLSFCPATHRARPFADKEGLQWKAKENPHLTILHAVAPQQHQLCGELLHTSLPRDPDELRDIIPKRNGFVETAIEAYNHHRELVIRPDDVWLSILTQFSFYVNANSEALRSVFVTHEGKKELTVHAVATRYTMDVDFMADEMTKRIEENVVDPSLRDWIMPNFSTSTHLDKSTSAIVMMGIMKNYFDYTFGLLCGIPKVTLEGEKKDWEDVLTRLERLKEFGTETIAWYHLLRPIIIRFIAAYDKPNSPSNLDFWKKIVDWYEGSGTPSVSGWITAFCTFKANGKWQGPILDQEGLDDKAEELSQTSTSQFSSFFVRLTGDQSHGPDDVPYITINSNDIPCGCTYTDVKLIDNGEEFETMLVAGSIGMKICSVEGEHKAVRALPGWWYFIKEAPK